MQPPIIIELTEVEAQGYRLAGNSPDEGIESQIHLVLTVGGMEAETAQFMAQKLTTGALAARAKIAEATRFEIKVLTPPKPSTLIKSKKPTTKRGRSAPAAKEKE